MFIVYSIYIHRLDGLLFFFLLPFWKTRVLGKCPNELADKCHGEYLRFPRFKLVIKWEKAYQWGLSQLKNNRNQVFFFGLIKHKKKIENKKTGWGEMATIYTYVHIYINFKSFYSEHLYDFGYSRWESVGSHTKWL